MTEPNKEMKMRLSLLLDGELHARDNPRLLDKIETDAELKAAWGRYHLIGDVMRASGRVAVDQDFAARVSAAVRAEPTALAPKRSSKAPGDLRSRIAHFALAASLAAAAVLVGKSLTDHAGELNAGPQAVAQAPVGQPTPQAVENTAEARFNDYLLMHNETAYLAGSAGMLPYARLVGSGSDH
jgi:sigma-E factor negative regulatory protein RseA